MKHLFHNWVADIVVVNSLIDPSVMSFSALGTSVLLLWNPPYLFPAPCKGSIHSPGL